MEAASATIASRASAGWTPLGTCSRRFGLIVLLLVLPVYFGIQDLPRRATSRRLGNNLVEGLSNGAILALIALGYTLVYGIIELINFAHGEIFMMGSFVAFGMYGVFGLTEQTGTSG